MGTAVEADRWSVLVLGVIAVCLGVIAVWFPFPPGDPEAGRRRGHGAADRGRGWLVVENEDIRAQLTRWIAAGQSLLGALFGVLREYDRLRADTEAARREGERLREEVTRLRADYGRLLREREEIAESLGTLVARLGPGLLLQAFVTREGSRRERPPETSAEAEANQREPGG